jgi:hypothetical protein
LLRLLKTYLLDVYLISAYSLELDKITIGKSDISGTSNHVFFAQNA